MFNHSAISLQRAKDDVKIYLRKLERGMYRKVFVVQNCNYISQKPVGVDLIDDFQQTPVLEF